MSRLPGNGDIFDWLTGEYVVISSSTLALALAICLGRISWLGDDNQQV